MITRKKKTEKFGIADNIILLYFFWLSIFFISSIYPCSTFANVASFKSKNTVLLLEDTSSLIKQADKLFSEERYELAIQAYMRAIETSGKNYELKGYALHSIGRSYYRLKDYINSINYYEMALQVRRNIQDKKGEVLTLNNIGLVYEGQNNYTKAIEYHFQALKLSKESGDLVQQGKSLNNIGLGYYYLDSYALSLDYLQKSLKVSQDLQNVFEQSKSINNIGLVYNQLGDYKKSLEKHKIAFYLLQSIQDKSNEKGIWLEQGRVLHNIGFAYSNSKKYEESLKYYSNALEFRRKANDLRGEAQTLNNIGDVYKETRNYSQSLVALRKSLEIAKLVKDLESIGQILDSIGYLYKSQNQYFEALKFYQEALIISMSPYNRAITFRNLGDLFAKQGNTSGAIVFYKQAVNTYETIRKDIRGLPTELQNSYKENVAGTYRELADLLLQQNRVLEAQRVLDLLKIQELDEFLRGVRGNTNTQRGIENLPPEQQINQGYQKLIDQAVSIGKELTKLRSIKPKERTIAQDQLIAQLDQQETELVKAFTKFIDSDEVKALLKKLEAIAFNQQDLLGRLSEFNALQDNLRNLQQDAVLLYPLILENRLELVLVTPYSPPIRRTVNVTSKELNQTIVDFRSALENPHTDATKPAQKLYDWLIKPIEKDLDTANTKTIIYAPDGQLRYIPLAALHDGKQWLVERYRVNNITAASLTDLNTKPQRDLSVLAGAYTTSGKKHNFAIGDEQFNFAGLPYAEMEVSKLAETIPDTTQLRDEGFSFKITKPKMDDYAIVHFATHAAFLKGQPEKSFILFGNGDRISLTDIKEGAFGSLKKVDLFVLSACETGVGGNFGTGAEILGFGYLMQTTGARAAIASLWKVNDSGTQALMNTFYATLANNAITKAEALRQAQIALITGNYKTVAGSRGQMVAIEQRIRQGLPNDVANNLSHPYYWASFILIGNGL